MEIITSTSIIRNINTRNTSTRNTNTSTASTMTLNQRKIPTRSLLRASRSDGSGKRSKTSSKDPTNSRLLTTQRTTSPRTTTLRHSLDRLVTKKARTVVPKITEVLLRRITRVTDTLLSRLIVGRLEVPITDILRMTSIGITDRLQLGFESFLRPVISILRTSITWRTLLLSPRFSVTLEKCTSSLRKSTR
jgi:hypothetical protein